MSEFCPFPLSRAHLRPFTHNRHVLAASSVRSQSGVRSGVLLAAATAVSIGAAYVFLLTAGRILGSEDYGSLAALLGLLTIVLIPAGALQMAISREVSRHIASGEARAGAQLAQGTLRAAAIATIPLLVVLVALAAPLSHVLNIHSFPVVVLAVLSLSTALVYPVALGVLQGLQRFGALATLYVFPWLVRLIVFGLAAAAGLRLGGAALAIIVGAVAAAAVALWLIREPLRGVEPLPRRELWNFLRYLSPVAVGLIGIVLLTNIDILIVKARFPGDEAGAYAAASAFARVAFFVPATILTVLFPRTAARQARGEETEDILGRSLLATLGFCAVLVVFYAAAGRGLLTATFGGDFAAGGDVLAPFALAIGLYSLTQILVGYHLSRGESRYAWIVAGSVLVQLAVLSLVPATLHAIVWANVVVAAALLAAHEVFAGSSIPALRAGIRHVEDARQRIGAFAPETIAVLVGAGLFVCALFAPVVAHPGSTIIGTLGSDSTASIADLWRFSREGGFHIVGTTHHTTSGAPFGWDQTNALNMQVLLAYYPAYIAAKVIGAIAAYNVLTLAGFALSGAAMYLLVRYLGCGRLVAAWSAVAYIVFPFHLIHEEHVSLVHLEVLALLLLALAAAARRPTWLRLSLVGVANLACWLMSGYFGPMATITTIAFAVGAALTLTRRDGLTLIAASVVGAVTAAGIVGIAAVVSGTNGAVGLNREPTDLHVFGIRAADLLVPPPQSLVFGDGLGSFWAAHSHGSNSTEIANYLGWLTIALAIAWVVNWWRTRRTMERSVHAATAGLIASFAAALAFAAPSPSTVLGGKITMPARLLWDVVPAFRVLSRWDFLLMSALIPLAALGLQAVSRTLATRSKALGVAAVAVAIAASFLELAIDTPQAHFRTTRVPQEYRALEQTRPGILAEYPLGYSDIYRLWQRVHGRPLLNGAPENTPADQARLVLLDPSQPGTAQALSLLGVTAIAIHPNGHADVPVAPQTPTGSGYRLVGRYAEGVSLWDVVAAPAPALVTVTGGFAAPTRESDGSVGYAFVAGGGVGALEVVAKTPGVVRIVFDAIPPKGTRKVLRLSDGSAEQTFTLAGPTRVSALVAIPRGRAQLLVKTDPPPTSEDDAIVISTPRAERASGQPALHAPTLSNDPDF
jgi:O-antigen/teichoic acid export membrane protein